LCLRMLIVARVIQLILRWGLTPLNLTSVINKHLTEVLLNVLHDFLIDIVSSGCATVLSETTLILVCWRLKLHVALELLVRRRWHVVGLNIIVRNRSIIQGSTHLITVLHLIAVALRGILTLIRGVVIKVLLLLLMWQVPLRHFIS